MSIKITPLQDVLPNSSAVLNSPGGAKDVSAIGQGSDTSAFGEALNFSALLLNLLSPNSRLKDASATVEADKTKHNDDTSSSKQTESQDPTDLLTKLDTLGQDLQQLTQNLALATTAAAQNTQQSNTETQVVLTQDETTRGSATLALLAASTLPASQKTDPKAAKFAAEENVLPRQTDTNATQQSEVMAPTSNFLQNISNVTHRANAPTSGVPLVLAQGSHIAPSADSAQFAPALETSALHNQHADVLPAPIAQPPMTNSTSSATPSTVSASVHTPLHHNDWANDFSQKIVWLANNDKQFAQLSLNPAQMGPIEISLNVSKDNASAFFTSPHPEVREAMEAALPRLREMLSAVGIELGQTNVSAESFKQQSEQGKTPAGLSHWNADNAILDPLSTAHSSVVPQSQNKGNSLVDLFA
ncbi:MAG: flagellar hook-length control protein FliK [Pseudomonadota bacterium]